MNELFEIEESPTLKMLAVEIDALNKQTGYHINQAVVYAAKTGAKLIEAKANCNDPEGFVKWLAKNVTDIKQATAYRYMKLSTDMPWLLDDLSQKINLPSITQAIELLSASEQLQNEVLERIENGEDVSIKEIQRYKQEANEAKALLGEKQKRLDWLEIDKVEITKQNDQLRNELAVKVDEKVNERVAGERAKLILENSNAIAQAQKEASDANDALQKLEAQKNDEIAALKKSQDKQVQEAIAQRFKELDAEIQEKQSIINGSKKTIDELNDVKQSLNSEVGDLNIHKKSISSFMDGITQLVSEYHRASETIQIPVETMNEWREINHALKGLSKEVSDWVNTARTIDGGVAVIGELVN